jgi:putative nucleotidyltransferase with HDIG domain
VKAIQIFVAIVCAAALAVAPLVQWGDLALLNSADGALAGYLALLGFGLLSESLTLRFTVARSAGQSSISFLPLLACIVLFGPAPTVLFMITIGVVGEVLIRKKENIRAVFNVSQWTFAATVGGLLYDSLGGQAVALVAGPDQASALLLQQTPVFVAFGAAFMLLNHTAVSLAIALSQEMPFSRVIARVVGRSGVNVFYDLLLSPIAIALAYLYLAAGVAGLALFLLPMLAIRHAYQINLRLQEANRDLLKALVKAIETRDPYTSGHSLRVSSLARRITEALGVTGRKADLIETAALLHDIGKIEPIYTEILRKPDGLSDAERSIIESHVTKGVDLLESVSSFPREVLDAVRYHHERVDGKGYPDGKMGDEIPLGARIIKVCDAVDAMLSDRPYRKALTIEAVEEQLVTYSGSQFDAAIVNAIVSSEMLGQHADEVRFDGVNRPGELSEAPEVEEFPVRTVS